MVDETGNMPVITASQGEKTTIIPKYEFLFVEENNDNNFLSWKTGNLDFQNDYVCLGNTKQELVEQVQYLKNESIRKDLGRKLRDEISRKYNAEIEVEKLIKIYNELV